jgi:HSP20 family protein
MVDTLTNFGGSLFDEFRRMEDQWDELLGRWPWPTGIRSVARGTYPPINVGTTPEQVHIYLFAAGLDPQKLNLSIQQNLLIISGEREIPVVENVNYYRKERFIGGFQRTIVLPEDVDPDRVEARYREGILQVTVKRHEATKPRQIEIK